ncbi:MmgE/PrpD family protein [Lutimaribacter saemankumensis]|uniref:2-methylcitrate dehydratase PrpD n=1 Tax=Lutimaribacter saemankumensis TaxID=490829 RepID=A0A1G8I6L7_9RHOB|nr:MmgE/PrpD family protein [Lutimaribacter saemankumensis]SDI14462.1 2-methylcitrate dehydratase PrpD [Lutimaribacter saemankumensis]
MTTNPIDFIHTLDAAAIPAPVLAQAKLSLRDLIGVAVGGSATRLAGIIRDHAAEDMPGTMPILFDGRGSTAAGAALSAGMVIDSLDGHDGFNPSKGHIGCPLLPAMLALAHGDCTGADFLQTLVMGYEFGARAAIAQHGSVPDYHTSGSWGAVTGAAAGARLRKLDPGQTRHALGIAEYHGPRSQMMRVIDHPTMLKDGSGWGALCAVQAVQMAARGFTGAPAITVEEAPQVWGDLGRRWYMLEQYYKPYPVCRWAQAPVEAILSLRRAHGLAPEDVARIEVETFHEAVRLATNRPRTTEEAQYSTSFPCALAMVHGDVTPAALMDTALDDPRVLRLSEGLEMVESAHANGPFPLKRLARVRLHLVDGRVLQSGWTEPRWDHDAPPTPDELHAKFTALAAPLGQTRAQAIADVIDTLETRPLDDLRTLLARPI